MSETLRIWWIVFKPLVYLLIIDILLIVISKGYKRPRGRR